MKREVIHGDCVEVMRSMDAASVDAIVTDPPYGLGFMGKKWDTLPPGREVFEECLRVLKPGGHLLAFGGARTYHRLAVAVEDAGFEIRDQIMWLYGSGFPKSLDVSKAIDKRGGTSAEFASFRDDVKQAMKSNKVTRSTLQNALGNFMLSHYLTAGSQPAVPNLRDYLVIRDTVGLGNKWDAAFNAEAEREVVGSDTKARSTSGKSALPTLTGSTVYETWDITAPATPAAQQWQGWGTALKPAHEPIVMARKPLIGTVAENALAHGTGGLNITGCRIGSEGGTRKAGKQKFGWDGSNTGQPVNVDPINAGRWPANLIHDGSPEATQNMGDAARYFYCAKANKRDRNEGLEELPLLTGGQATNRADGSAGVNNPRPGARRTKGNRNTHPTVKPTDLMRYLVRLVTPPGGTVLDPFTGSGSTGKAAALEGFAFVGIEKEKEYVELARARLEHVG